MAKLMWPLPPTVVVEANKFGLGQASMPKLGTEWVGRTIWASQRCRMNHQMPAPRRASAMTIKINLNEPFASLNARKSMRRPPPPSSKAGNSPEVSFSRIAGIRSKQLAHRYGSRFVRFPLLMNHTAVQPGVERRTPLRASMSHSICSGKQKSAFGRRPYPLRAPSTIRWSFDRIQLPPTRHTMRANSAFNRCLTR